MERGKKNAARSIVYGALDDINENLKHDNPLEVFETALRNTGPVAEVRSRRIGGATYQVPIEVTQSRGVSLALRWIRDYARTKKGKPMQDRLAEELFSAYNGEGSSIKKRDDTHKMAEANKAFAHFRW